MSLWTTAEIASRFLGTQNRSDRVRDKRTLKSLRFLGWQVLVVWQCQTKDLEKLEKGSMTSFSRNPIDNRSSIGLQSHFHFNCPESDNTTMRPIGIDLFSGAGGLSLGFEQAGFDVVAAVEIDPVHAAIHKFNFPKCAVLARSVADLSAEDIRKHAQIGNRPVDVVFGGAPCQGFSLIGHRALDDPRNSLVREFVRIVAELDASYFVFENVRA